MHDISLIMLITLGLGSALILGAITNRLGLSPIVGYLLAGLLVSPVTPGFVANPELAGQLAEIGVILLMFGVGLHFHVEDLLRVKGVAIPGAIIQSALATLLTIGITQLCGMSLISGVILGIAVAVASTVVLVRVLTELGLLHTRHGHIAIGWLVVEDLFTVLILVLLPALKEAMAEGNPQAIVISLLVTAVKIAALFGLVWLVGRSAVPAAMSYMARTRSRELFTLSVLVVALGFAVGSATVFGVSMALGAFLAGMVVGQSDVSHQAASDALPMRDAFAVLFFVSVGMLLDPMESYRELWMISGLLAVILIGKPLAAAVTVLVLGYPLRSALVVAMALAQIGEFSFILGDVASHLGFLTKESKGVLVTCAVISITINPFLFKLIHPIEDWFERRPHLKKYVKGRLSPDELTRLSASLAGDRAIAKAVVVGYGPVGQMLTRILREFDIDPVIVDLNIETVRRLRKDGVRAIYGDASKKDILLAAEIDKADFFVVTLPGQFARETIIEEAQELNPAIKSIMRAHYLKEGDKLRGFHSLTVAYEELEVAVALAEVLLRAMGMDDTMVHAKSADVRRELELGLAER